MMPKVLLFLLAATRAFVPASRHRAVTRLRAGGDAILDAPNWPSVKRVLDELPVFTCANAQGQPLQYERGGQPLALFYSCIEACREELKLAKEEWPNLELDIVPIGLGEAFRLHREGAGVLIPAKDAVVAAGAPPEAPPMGQEMPLFACMEMAREGPNGTPQLPLFLSHAEAKAAIDDAVAADGGGATLDLVCLSLNKALEQLVTQDEQAFAFVAPEASLAHIRSYLENSGGVPGDQGGS